MGCHGLEGDMSLEGFTVKDEIAVPEIGDKLFIGELGYCRMEKVEPVLFNHPSGQAMLEGHGLTLVVTLAIIETKSAIAEELREFPKLMVQFAKDELNWVGDHWVFLPKAYRICVEDAEDYLLAPVAQRYVITDTESQEHRNIQSNGIPDAIRNFVGKTGSTADTVTVSCVHNVRLEIAPRKLVASILRDLSGPQGGMGAAPWLGRLCGGGALRESIQLNQFSAAILESATISPLKDEGRVDAFCAKVIEAWTELVGGDGIWWWQDSPSVVHCARCYESLIRCSCAE
jgi:hypothetical protein